MDEKCSDLKMVGKDCGSVFRKKSICISNCIDTDKFGIDIPIKKRDALSIAALYHRADHKGFKYTWKAIQMIKERSPNVRVRCFGSSKKPKWMPD